MGINALPETNRGSLRIPSQPKLLNRTTPMKEETLKNLTVVVTSTCAASLILYGTQKFDECGQECAQAIAWAMQAAEEQTIEKAVTAGGHAALGCLKGFVAGCCLVVGMCTLIRIATPSA